MQSITVNIFQFVQTNGARVASHIKALPSSILEIIYYLGRLLQTSTLAQFTVGVVVGLVVNYLFRPNRVSDPNDFRFPPMRPIDLPPIRPIFPPLRPIDLPPMRTFDEVWGEISRRREEETNRRIEETNRRIEETNRRIEETHRRIEEIMQNLRNPRSPPHPIFVAIPHFDFRASGINFDFSRHAMPVANECATFAEAVDFWSALLPRAEVSPIQMDLRRDQEIDLTRFLNRLKATAEYQNLAARPTLAKRIYDVLKEMRANEEFKETACVIIHEGMSTCHDRIISALDELDLMMQIKKAEARGGREELRKLGRGMLMLEEVQKAAKAHARTLISVDEIEIRLAFQIGLRDRLQLPLSTGHMIFRGCADVSDQKIRQVGARIERTITDAKVEAYLQTWSPWQKLLRREAFAALEPEVVQAPEDLEWVCCVGTEELSEGYLYDGHLYAHETLRKIYIEKGLDPFTREQMNLDNVKKVVRGEAS